MSPEQLMSEQFEARRKYIACIEEQSRLMWKSAIRTMIFSALVMMVLFALRPTLPFWLIGVLLPQIATLKDRQRIKTLRSEVSHIARVFEDGGLKICHDTKHRVEVSLVTPRP